MARRRDPERYEARRLQIIDAALTTIAARGYDGATTAAICEEAAISSGTFFHYFPTKLDVLLAIFALGAGEREQLAAELSTVIDPLAALERIVSQTLTDARDPRIPGFVRAIGAVMTDERIAAALTADAQAQHNLLVEHVTRAQLQGLARSDLSAERLAAWLQLLTDGFLEQVATAPGFVPDREEPVLRQLMFALLGASPSVS